jgi:hypothetical protein
VVLSRLPLEEPQRVTLQPETCRPAAPGRAKNLRHASRQTVLVDRGPPQITADALRYSLSSSVLVRTMKPVGSCLANLFGKLSADAVPAPLGRPGPRFTLPEHPGVRRINARYCTSQASSMVTHHRSHMHATASQVRLVLHAAFKLVHYVRSASTDEPAGPLRVRDAP